MTLKFTWKKLGQWALMAIGAYAVVKFLYYVGVGLLILHECSKGGC